MHAPLGLGLGYRSRSRSRLHGLKLTQFMDQSYHLAIYHGETVSVRPILQEVEELREELAAAVVELSINSMKAKMNDLLK